MANSIVNQLNRIETGIGPMTDRILNNIVNKVTSGDFKELLTDKIADPIMIVINKKVQPYLYGALLLYVILIILLCFIIYLLLTRKR